MRFKIVLTVILFVSMTNSLTGQGKEINIGERSTLYSVVLKEERNYLIYLPPSHKDSTLTEKYPVLYVLDGDWYFHITTGIIDYSKGSFKLPEMIVVGISSKDRVKEMTPTNSATDMYGNKINGLENSGGGELFIDFIEKELIPHIDSNYRTMNYRILAGHSFGGLLANHIFTTNNELFNSYILIDPSLWWNESKQLKQTEKFLKENPEIKSMLYFGEADNKKTSTIDNIPHIESMEYYKKIVDSKRIKGLRYKFNLFKEETHASVGLPSMYYGLSFIFTDYRPADSVFQKANLLADHYNKLSNKYGVKILPPEGLVRNLGWGAQYGEKNINKAKNYFELNMENYPKSANSYKVLGEAYEAENKIKEALINYKKSLEINPMNKSLEEKIRMLIKE